MRTLTSSASVKLADQHHERFRNAGFYHVLTHDDRFGRLHAIDNVVGFDREEFFERVRHTVGLECPVFHFAEALVAKLRLAAQRLLRDHQVGAR